MVVHIFNPSTQEAEADEFLSSRLPALQSEFQDSQGYTEKPCLEKQKQKNQKNQKTKTKQTKQTWKQSRGEEFHGNLVSWNCGIP